MRDAVLTGMALAAVLLGGCASLPPASESTGEATAVGRGAFIVRDGPTRQGVRYPITADGSAGPGVELPWQATPPGEVVLLKDALGQWALTSTVAEPLTDVSATKQLQVRDIATGDVRHALDVRGWCSGADGASYPCLLVDDTRVVRTTPVDGERTGTITVSSLLTGETLAEFGPFPALAGVLATSSPEVVVVVSFESTADSHLFQTLDLATGELAEIGRVPTSQPWLCVLGTDSVLTYDKALAVTGPAQVPALVIPELGPRGPGTIGCSPDSRFLYLETNYSVDPAAELVIDAIDLTDGERTSALTMPTQSAVVLVTR